MICAIIAGSPELNIDLIKDYPSDYLIGVDSGAYQLIKQGYSLDLAIGDFDSVGTNQFIEIVNKCGNVKKYEKRKDKTDTELAIDEAIKEGAKEIILFGVTGRRLDHFLGTLNLFHLLIKKQIKLTIVDDYNRITLIEPGVTELIKDKYKYISFFSYGDQVKNLNLTGFKYDLKKHTLKNVGSLCISNEIIGMEASVQFDSGLLMVVESND